jgi:phosphatidylglycerophosphatase A
MTKNFKNIFLSLGGIGFSKYAPGTLGSAIAAVFLFFLKYGIHNIYLRISLASVVFILIYVISIGYIREFKLNGKFDHSWIVTDEFSGMMIAGAPFLILNSAATGHLFWGFLLFRIFDIFKFWPVSSLDRINTPQFVILDDILAGFFALAVIVLIRIT